MALVAQLQLSTRLKSQITCIIIILCRNSPVYRLLKNDTRVFLHPRRAEASEKYKRTLNNVYKVKDAAGNM